MDERSFLCFWPDEPLAFQPEQAIGLEAFVNCAVPLAVSALLTETNLTAWLF